MRRSSERGQAAPLLAAVLVVAVALALVIAQLGVAAVQRARARTAADAAALAGAAEGEAAAREVAAENGGDLESFVAEGPVVEVVVRVGPARARATAEGTVGTGVGPDGLAPAIVAALARAEQVLGRPVPVVAVVDGGLAVEVDPGVVEALAAESWASGLCQQGPVHFAACPPSSPG